jgi:hypothetical protein
MRTARNVVAFVGVLIAIVLLYPMALTAMADAFVDGREFASYGGLSWPPVIFLLVSAVVFLIGGGLLAWLIASRHVQWWALALGVAYGAIRAYSSRHQLSLEHTSIEILWGCLELIVPPIASGAGAYILGPRAGRNSSGVPAA